MTRSRSAVKASEPAQQAAEVSVEVSTAVAHEKAQHRTTMPVAPKTLVGENSRMQVQRLRMMAAGAVYVQGSLTQLIAAVQSVPTKNMHASVSEYKAEVLDYLRGKAEKLEAGDEQQ